jgi:CRISPR-associated protein (TIGR03986 family)
VAAEFINPYTFVPLPNTIDRRAPLGHHRAAEGSISGRMTVTWTMQTPLLLPKTFTPDPGSGPITVPGSSIKGAVRSLHETLMGGCLRVVDGEFVPVYREPAVTKSPESWWLAVVESATAQGRATTVRLTRSSVWMPIDSARGALGRPPNSGDTVDIADNAIPENSNSLGRRKIHDSSRVSRGDSWVLLVGDSGTRQRSRGFFVAAGEVGEASNLRSVPTEVWDEYEQLCQGTNDMRLIKQKPDDEQYKGWQAERIYADVEWKSAKIGKRRRVTGRLWSGDVIWVGMDAHENVEHLSMAAIWRAPGRGSVNERIPAALQPCQDADDLCVSCRLFGSADTGGAEIGAEAEQHAYAGHVRFGDAVTAGPVEPEPVRLAPMGAPRAGAGQFYLRHNNLAPAQSKGELPAAAWGSQRDKTNLRSLAGRKYYWHGDPNEQKPPRHIARESQLKSKLVDDHFRYLVPAGTVLTQTITFDNVPPIELAALLLTLLPGLFPELLPRAAKDPVRRSGRHALRIGGGKPLGLGSCTVDMTNVMWWQAADRYLGRQAITEAPREFVARYLGDVKELAGLAVTHWRTLDRILRTDGVEAKLVWYPLGGEWDNEQQRDRSFEFFNATNGKFLEHNPKNIEPLPNPDPDDPCNPNPRQVLRFPPGNGNGRRR